MIEKNFQSLFTAWMRDNSPPCTSVFELKLEKGASIAFARLYDHQVEALRKAKNEGMYHKISDVASRAAGKEGFFRFTKPKPFDCMFIRDARAYIVLLFYEPRRPKQMLFVDIDDWVRERDSSTRKSLTKVRAVEIASYRRVL